MAHLIGLAGSLRQGSWNQALLRAAQGCLGEGHSLEVASIEGIPLYNGDVEEAQGIPQPVAALKDKIAQADGLILSTPEYNHGIPGVMKNALDWLTRPPEDIARVFAGKPVALMGATPGGMGTAFSQTAWLPVFRVLAMRPYFGKSLYVSKAFEVFDEAGNLVDEGVQGRLTDFLAGFGAFIQG